MSDQKLIDLKGGKTLYDDLRERVEGQSVPKGGSPGQVLTKTSNEDYSAAWRSPAPGGVTDVKVNGTSVVSDGVANVPIGSSSQLGVVKANNNYGTAINAYGEMFTFAASISDVKAGTNSYKPIVPGHQQEAAFYGLAKAAGDSTQAVSSNPVGTYTNGAKTAIKTMLGVSDPTVTDVMVNGTSVVSQGVANVPKAGSNTFGVVKASSSYGITASLDGSLKVVQATSSNIKAGTDNVKPIVPYNQHEATFYGLAKASGDATQSASSKAVGTYTDAAKSAISTMLNGSVSVSGTTPTITALPGLRYVCGEVSTLNITLPASGCIDVVFESGSTPTVLTITPPTGVTVKWANGFDPTILDASTTYEINIANGLGVAGSWT